MVELREDRRESKRERPIAAVAIDEACSRDPGIGMALHERNQRLDGAGENLRVGIEKKHIVGWLRPAEHASHRIVVAVREAPVSLRDHELGPSLEGRIGQTLSKRGLIARVVFDDGDSQIRIALSLRNERA